jgi:hypothetical protein
MPVPPQESAPSLSPRQSFGCQSPLPWVTGTGRTGILRALWQLQGSFQESSSPSAHSLTWRSRSQANKPHAVPYCAVTTIHRKHRHRFPNSVQQSLDDLTTMFSEQGLHTQANSASPKPQDSSRDPHWLLASWELHSQVISETGPDSTAPNRGLYTGLPRKTQAFSL